MADPRHGTKKHHRANAVFVRTIEAAVDLIERRGFSIRMEGEPGRPALIAPRGLRVLRV